MSSSVIGALRVNLGIDSAAFDRGLQNARGSLDRFGAQLQTWGAGLTKAITLPLVGAAGGVGAAIQAMAGNVDELKKQAQISNTDIQGFQRLAFAAKSVGFEADKLSDIFKDVNDKVGEFRATGAGEMKDFFENVAPKVGVTADMFAKLSGPEALQLYYNTLEKAGVSQQKMTFYLEALANDATALIPLLRENGKGFRDLGASAAALSGSNIATLDAYNMAVRRLGEAFKSLVIAIVNSGLVDSLTSLINKVTEWTNALAQSDPAIVRWVAALGGIAAVIGPALIGLGVLASVVASISAPMLAVVAAVVAFGGAIIAAANSSSRFGEIIRSVGQWMADTARMVIDEWHRVKLIWPALEVAMAAFGQTVAQIMSAATQAVVGFVNQAVSAINTLIRGLNSVSEYIGAGALAGEIQYDAGTSAFATAVENNAKRAQHAFGTALLKMKFAMQEPLPSEGVTTSIKDVADNAVQAAEVVDLTGDKIAGGGRKAAGGLSEAARAAKQLAEEGKRVWDDTRTPLEQYQLEIQRLNELVQAGAIDWDTYNRAVKQAQDELEGAKESTDNIASSLASQFTSAFMSIIDGTKSAKEAFADLAKSILSMFMNRVLQNIFDQIFGGLMGGLGGMGGMGGLALGPNGPVMSSFGGMGPSMAPAMVGDGGGANVTVVNNTGQQATARETTDGRGQRKIEVVVGEMVGGEAQRPGSHMHQAMRGAFGLSPSLVKR